MKRYEYEVLKITSNVKEILIKMGSEGWELITINNNSFYFKRSTKETE